MTRRAGVGLDSSVLVAMSCDWHVAHAASRSAVDSVEKSGARLIIPAAVLVETYAVLTRLPPPRRMRPSMVVQLLRSNLGEAAIEVLERDDVWPLIDSAAEAGVAGGAIYDRVVASSLTIRGVGQILTLNPRHFAGIEGLTVLVPA